MQNKALTCSEYACFIAQENIKLLIDGKLKESNTTSFIPVVRPVSGCFKEFPLH